ncbi:MAG: hypothetical protein HND48_11220 [Chloroflexi bacterium]|nr:hypothetical protein [Chloroflexota bacterium]
MTSCSAAAAALIDAGIVGFAFDSPRTFKSGLIAPVYLDNRKLIFHPQAWHVVIDCLAEMLGELYPERDIVVAGVETAGIPHSSALGVCDATPDGVRAQRGQRPWACSGVLRAAALRAGASCCLRIRSRPARAA